MDVVEMVDQTLRVAEPMQMAVVTKWAKENGGRNLQSSQRLFYSIDEEGNPSYELICISWKKSKSNPRWNCYKISVKQAKRWINLFLRDLYLTMA